MKTIMKTLVLVAVVGVMFCGFDALAQNYNATQGWNTAFNVMIKTFKNVRTLVYVIGAFGLIGIAIGGIMGKIKWQWLGYLAAGLAIVAAADMIISYATGFGKNTVDKNADITWSEDWGN